MNCYDAIFFHKTVKEEFMRTTSVTAYNYIGLVFMSYALFTILAYFIDKAKKMAFIFNYDIKKVNLKLNL